DQLADGLDPVVRSRVELVHVEARACLDAAARLASEARLAVDRRLAVQHLREDPSGRRLAGAAWPTEEVRVADPSLTHGVAQCRHDVVLASHLGKTARPVAPVEGFVGHGADSTDPAPRPKPASRAATRPWGAG